MNIEYPESCYSFYLSHRDLVNEATSSDVVITVHQPFPNTSIAELIFMYIASLNY